ncbi:MAG TPA: carbon storage regulator CsrA [Melioribacteraceae bacterium]|nr:carbon storage regulator CsrA [Melioribacteraceae bacterium]
MLVLTRKLNEKIRVGNDIIINVLAINENQIKLGIDAPNDVKIYREEIYEKVKDYAVEAAKRSTDKPEQDIKQLAVNKLNVLDVRKKED